MEEGYPTHPCAGGIRGADDRGLAREELRDSGGSLREPLGQCPKVIEEKVNSPCETNVGWFTLCAHLEGLVEGAKESPSTRYSQDHGLEFSQELLPCPNPAALGVWRE